MDPQQELFTALLLQLKEAFPGKVYDGFLPPEDTPYPFVYLADSQLIDTEMKNAVTGTVYQTIDVWHSTPENGVQFRQCFCRSRVFAENWNIQIVLPG